jgi:heterodisulfide reductase subunit A
MTRIGIFLCTCDQKINESIDVASVEKAVQKPVFLQSTPEAQQSGAEKMGFCHVTRVPHACLPDGKRDLSNAIIENNIERVVVAACPARFQEKHLRDVCVDTGVNVNHFALVDWREGCAWAHCGDTENATAKAIDLVQMGVERVANANPLDGMLAKIEPRVLGLRG